MSDRPPQVGDSTNLLLKKLVTATQALATGGGGGFLTVAEANALYLRLDGTNIYTGSSITASGGQTLGFGAAGAITLTAAGTNQNVTVTPSGTGAIGLGSAGLSFATVLPNGSSTPISAWSDGASGGFSFLTDTSANEFTVGRAGGGTSLFIRNSAGTLAVPTTVVNLARPTTIISAPYDGTNFISSSSIQWVIDGVPSTGSVLQRFQVAGSPTGTGTRIVYGEFRANGRLEIGSAAKTISAWGVSGTSLLSIGSTFTDSSSSGTVATAVANSFAVPTFAASSATTFTNAANLYIAGDVAAGTNVTLTNSYGLWNVGKTRLDGAVQLPSTNTAGLQIYNTVDQVTDYERLEALWSSNVATIRTTSGGSGSVRALAFGTGNGQDFRLDASTLGYFRFRAPTTSAAGALGFSLATSGSWTQTSGTQAFMSVTPTYNQASGTAANTDLLINRTETLVGSGTQYLIQAQVGGASKFSITNLGFATLAGPIATTPFALTYASPTSVDVTKASCYTVTTVNATGSVTFNANGGGTAGQELTIIITNDATSAKTITFGSNFRSTGTLTASAVSRHTTITFKSDGTAFNETGRAVLGA